ncbi:MAG: lipase family protein [Halomonadaceae bacterium]|nr:MAG: lipase family protein [Halomonadaceae bacterium]
MLPLTPAIAAELAEAVYEVMEPSETGIYNFPRTPELNAIFNFDLNNGPIRGSTGGFFGLYRRTSGFAVIGQGKAHYQGHHVVALRGTKTLNDKLTDANFGLSPSHGGPSVHAGFNTTFSSMKPLLEKQLNPQLRSDSAGLVHCVGHSLGGALASLAADWIKARYQRPVNLYTFGAPRVGLEGFATQSTGSSHKIYRCTHGADVVPKLPLWPFIHAPNQGALEYRLDSGQGMSLGAHSMGVTGNPGYRNTAKGSDWSGLQKQSSDFLNQPVRLSYDRRHQASFSGYWADRLNAALVTLLKDAGYYTLVVAQAGIGTSLTFYDMLARTLENVAKASVHFAEQTRGLLGHMLVFAGKTAITVGELSYRFIRWVFDQTLGALYRIAKETLNQL